MTAAGETPLGSKPVPLQRTIKPLLLAPLPTLVVVAAEYVFRSGPVDPLFVFTLPVVALACYAGELLMVVPLFLVWPSLRKPSLGVAAIWGLLVAGCTITLLFGLGRVSNMELPAATFLGVSGIASGLTYAVAIRWLPSQGTA